MTDNWGAGEQFYVSRTGRVVTDGLAHQLNPIERMGATQTSQEIQNRMNEISFDGSLLKESRSIDFFNRLICQGRLPAEDYR